MKKGIVRKYWILSIPVLLDLFFLYILTRLHLEVLTKISEHMTAITGLISQTTGSATTAQLLGLESALMTNPDFVMHYHSILKFIALFIGVGFCAWMILQGIAWFISHRSLHRISFFRYMGAFVLYSILWFVVFIGGLFIVVSLFESSTYGYLPYIGETGIAIVSALFMVILGYFAAVSYAIPTKKSYEVAWKGAKTIGLYYFAMVGATAAFVVLGTWLFALHWIALLVFFLFVLLPSFTVYRVFFIRQARKISAT